MARVVSPTWVVACTIGSASRFLPAGTPQTSALPRGATRVFFRTRHHDSRSGARAGPRAARISSARRTTWIADERPASQVQRGDRPLRLARSHTASLTHSLRTLRQDLEPILHGALAAIAPDQLLDAASARGVFDPVAGMPVVVVAAGKAAVPMASAFARRAPVSMVMGMVTGPTVATGAPPGNSSGMPAGTRTRTRPAASPAGGRSTWRVWQGGIVRWCCSCRAARLPCWQARRPA